jgi:nitroreductase
MNIEQFLELAKKRRSIRRFKPDPVPDEIIQKILEAARWAMSGANGQPWEFIVVKDKEIQKKLFEEGAESERQVVAVESSRVLDMRQPFYRNIPEVIPSSRFSEAPVIIVVCGDPRTAQATVLNRVCDRRWVVDENMANATQILHLAVAACGLGSLTPDVNSGHEIFLMLRPALHRTVVHRRPGIGIPAVLAVFADCRRPRCTR